MIACIFTVDYEIYGNGGGSLRELVYEPAEKLKAVFQKWDARFVTFVEAAELEVIEKHQADDAIGDVRRQIVELYRQGHEIGLHLHPQWYNARFEGGKWVLDDREYNLCTLPRERIEHIVERSITYLRNVLDEPDFTPLSFRAGNWLLQPTLAAANVLAEHGIKIDSSVFKGGLQHQHKMDYRPAARNGYCWMFQDDVNSDEPRGSLIEIPIYTRMVPFWKMATKKRVELQQKGSSGMKTAHRWRYRLFDMTRFKQPMKLDFCRMTINELTRMVDTVIREDEKDTTSFRPVVVIGHTKDLIDYNTVESFLGYLGRKGIGVSTFKEVYSKCTSKKLV